MRKISASVLSADFGRLAEHVSSAEQAGVAGPEAHPPTFSWWRGSPRPRHDG